MKTNIRSEPQQHTRWSHVHGWELLDNLASECKSVAAILFDSMSTNKCTEPFWHTFTVNSDYDKSGSQHLIAKESPFAVKCFGKIFYGVAPTRRSAQLRINRIVKFGACAAAGYPPKQS